MAALLNVEMDGVAQVMQYEDDSVEAWFTDGARIVLTACAASFTRQDGPEKDGNLPRKASTFHQFTAYAVRECRDRVRQLVAFRNCFAERPFLSSSLLDPEVDLQVDKSIPLRLTVLDFPSFRCQIMCASMQHGPPASSWLPAVN